MRFYTQFCKNLFYTDQLDLNLEKNIQSVKFFLKLFKMYEFWN